MKSRTPIVSIFAIMALLAMAYLWLDRDWGERVGPASNFEAAMRVSDSGRESSIVAADDSPTASPKIVSDALSVPADTSLPISTVAAGISDGSALLIENPSKIVEQMFLDLGPQTMANRVDTYMSMQEPDENWSNTTRISINQWFRDGVSADLNSSQQFSTECVSSVCYVDIRASHIVLTRDYLPLARSWVAAHPEGFLQSYFSVKAGDEYYRLYLFRDTLDPGAL